MTTLRADYRSDIGDRETNEDCAAVFAGGLVFLVADGMGGQRGGEIASRLAAETVGANLARPALPDADAAVLRVLERLFDDANERLLTEVRRQPGLWGLGTTLTLGVVHRRQLFFGHVGDSRLYRWRGGDCQQLTEDHTRAQELVRQGLISEEEGGRSRQRNVLTRYLGTPASVDPQVGTCDLRPGDRLLLCSDGLHTGIGNERLAQLLATNTEPGELAQRLVRHAGTPPAAGQPRDNITALVVFIDA